MKKVMIELSTEMKSAFMELIPALPAATEIDSQARVKLRGDWLPDKFETPQGGLIQTISLKELAAILATVYG